MAKKSRKISLVSYADDDFVLSVIQSKSKFLRGYAYATHDCDLNDDGSLKERHIHIILWLFEARDVDSIRRWFRCVDCDGQQVNTLGQPCIDVTYAFEYLTHRNTPNKYQYSGDIVVCSDPSLFECADDVNEDCSLGALEDMLAGVPLVDIARKYGRDFIYHYHHLKLLYTDILGDNYARD